ncbi:GOLPH3/VPS74 family protein [Sphaerisporangium rhizosphaerae]|uniref:GPP34 family phosphoprotein n=1 Tax=Sphaerisporangium rhizosphaerae TaxID=2269375 RepID=A0ABW2NW48_9ACTN
MDLPGSLPQRLYLLAYDIERGRPTARWKLGYLMRAGILAELLLRGCLDDATGGPVASRTAVPDDALLDAALQQIAASRRRTWQHWVNKGSHRAVRQVRDQLEAGGWIRVRRTRLLGVIPLAKVTVRDTRVVRRLTSTVSSAMRGGQPLSRVEPRDAALTALASVIRLRTVMPWRQWRAVRERGEALGVVVAPVPRALHKAIQAAQAAAAGS